MNVKDLAFIREFVVKTIQFCGLMKTGIFKTLLLQSYL
jgi:hypothetical protein